MRSFEFSSESIMTGANQTNDSPDSRTDETCTVRRRRFVGGVGAVGLSSPFLGIAAAGDRFDDPTAVRERANEIRTEAGQRAWKEFLRSHGFSLTSMEYDMNVHGDGVSSNGFDNVDGTSSDCDICLEFTLFVDQNGDVYTIDMYWTYDAEKAIGGGGYSPDDGLGLYFDPQYWDYESNSLSGTTYTSDKDVVSVEDDSVNDGLPFVADDSFAGDGTGYWAGLEIVPIGDYSSSERYVYGQYVHTWNSNSTDYSIGVSYPSGVSIVFDTDEDVKKEATGTEGDGDTLMKLNQSEAI